MRTVAANAKNLIGWNRSMAVALERAENGSQAEDGDFIEKLRKSAAVLGYSLALCKDAESVPERPSERAMRLTAPTTTKSNG